MSRKDIGIFMNATTITLIVSLAIATLGTIIELSSRARTRSIDCQGNKKPSFIHKNLRLMGPFRYMNGKVYYHSFCFGPLPLFPIGCYLSEGVKPADVKSSVKTSILEIFALYARWGWVIAAVTIAVILL